MKKIFGFSCLILACLTFLLIQRHDHRPKNCHQPSFGIDAISSIFPSDPRWVYPLEKEIKECFYQKFTYWGDGGQCYAFISEDRCYVLKFLKQHKFAKNKTSKAKGFKAKEAFLKSQEIAYGHLKEETGLLYLHFVPQKEFKQQVTLIDHNHCVHSLELGNFEFLLQRRADAILDAISDHMQNNDEEAAKKIIDAIFSFFRHRLDKGIIDFDPQIVGNIGLINGKIMQFDTGRFALAKTPKDLKKDLANFFSKNKEFRKWLESRFPTLHQYYIAQTEDFERYHKQIQL